MTACTDGPPELHPQLAADCHVLGSCAGNVLLLHRNAMVPWFLLVPPTPLTELHELPPPLRTSLDAAADELARFIKQYFACDKINVAAIGNVVPQLHVHVIGRRRDDACWPRPVWGNLTRAVAHTPEALTALSVALRAADCLD
jgi:diadenosine tetraphosphate (Ap4A) HIT family hydrolase